MGRLNKNACDYFPHNFDMRNHRKVKALRTNFKNGYAIWSMLLEFLTGADGNEFENSEIEYELLSGDFGFPVTDIRSVVEYCIKIEMLFEKNGFIYSESLNEKLAPVYEKRQRAKEMSSKQKRKNGKYITEETVTPEITVTEKPHSRVDETKVDETKVNNILNFGSKKNVLLTNEQYNNLITIYSKEITDEQIEQLSKYDKIGKYTDHNLTIHNWVQRKFPEVKLINKFNNNLDQLLNIGINKNLHHLLSNEQKDKYIEEFEKKMKDPEFIKKSIKALNKFDSVVISALNKFVNMVKADEKYLEGVKENKRFFYNWVNSGKGI